jgi:hypothetical protein
MKILKKYGIFLFALLLLLLQGCITLPERDEQGHIYVQPKEYNCRIAIYDDYIRNPANDRRCYYRIFIDKIEKGRTTTGLESQKKFFDTSLTVNRHLLRIEKWVLNEGKGQYVKLNNIEQPRPSHFYFSIPENRVVAITVKTGRNRKTEYRTDLMVR